MVEINSQDDDDERSKKFERQVKEDDKKKEDSGQRDSMRIKISRGRTSSNNRVEHKGVRGSK